MHRVYSGYTLGILWVCTGNTQYVLPASVEVKAPIGWGPAWNHGHLPGCWGICDFTEPGRYHDDPRHVG